MVHAVLFLAFWLSSAAAAEAPVVLTEAEGAAAAIHWIFLPGEQRQARDLLESPEEWADFVEDVWKRRDPTPLTAGNRHRDTFLERVAEADELFGGEGRKGSLTDRGRSYVLVGPPSQIAQRYRPTPQFSPITTGGRALRTSKILVETWSWRPEDLTPELREQLREKRWKTELVVEFRVLPNRYSLLEGESLLKLAARALLRPSER